MAVKDAVCHLKFQAISGYFINLSAKAEEDSSFRAATLTKLGLIEREYDIEDKKTIIQENKAKPWQKFRNYVDQLNQQSEDFTTYKVLYITRHGLGYHNTFEVEVGHDAWNDHWSHLDGDGTVVWADAQLNDQGINQAKILGDFWSKSVGEDQIPLPGAVYTSPLARCLETTRLEFAKVFEDHGLPFKPIVKELLRERLTDHTCDRRSTRGWIEENYPDYSLENGFTEEDQLWTGGIWETEDQHTARKQQVLEDIFLTDGNAFVALTVHSYAISAILRVVGLGKFRVKEGGCIALLVKAEKVNANMR